MDPAYHSIAISLSHPDELCAQPLLCASGGLMWIDEPFVVTAAHVVRGMIQEQGRRQGSQVWLGCLALDDLSSRVLSLSEEHDLATLWVRPNELHLLGKKAAFFNPQLWPPQSAAPGDLILVAGYPRDQWPARIEFTFRVESATDRRFGASLVCAAMPGRLAGLSGSPAFRIQRESLELVGIVVDALFHNEVVRAQHIRHMDPCGILPAGIDLA
jgi:hypothetical protein